MGNKRQTLGEVRVLGSGAFSLTSISSWSADPGLADAGRYAAGGLHPTHRNVTRIAPSLNVTTLDIDTFLDNVDQFDGLAIPQTTVYTGLESFLTNILHNLGRPTGSTHTKYAMSQCLIVPQTLTAPDNADATLSFLCVSSYDGTNEPMVRTASVALPGALTVGNRYTLGPIELNGTLVKGLQSWEYNFGLQVGQSPDSGAQYIDHVSIIRTNPTITWGFEDEEVVATSGIQALAQGGTVTEVWLRKWENQADVIDDATAEHIKLTVPIDQGIHMLRGFGGSNDSYLSGQAESGLSGGASEPVGIDTTAVIA